MRIRKPLEIDNPDILFLSKVSEALAHPVRVSILHYVMGNNEIRNDVCNSDLVKSFPYSQATLSQHVKKMVDADLFIIEKKDRFSMYSVNFETISKYTNILKLRRFK